MKNKSEPTVKLVPNVYEQEMWLFRKKATDTNQFVIWAMIYCHDNRIKNYFQAN